MRRVEARRCRDRARGGRAAAPAGIRPDELRAGDLGAARAASALDRARRSRGAPPPPSPRRSCSPARGRRAAGRGRARARPESRRRARGRRAAISRAPRRRRVARLTLNAISGLRAPTSTPPAARVEARGPEVRRELAGVDPPLQLLRAAAAEERRPAARRRARRRGTRAARAPRRPARASSQRRRRRARPMSSGRIGTIGTTSAAPIRGCAPSCAAQVDPLARDGDPREQRLDELVLRPTSVKTDRL